MGLHTFIGQYLTKVGKSTLINKDNKPRSTKILPF